jgi:hypothetical protein
MTAMLKSALVVCWLLSAGMLLESPAARGVSPGEREVAASSSPAPVLFCVLPVVPVVAVPVVVLLALPAVLLPALLVGGV